MSNSNFVDKETLSQSGMEIEGTALSSIPLPYLSKDRTLQFWTGALVVLPVFLQAPWAHFSPLSASLFTLLILLSGVLISQLGGLKWSNVGSLLVGVSGSWLGGSLFWGWLRAYPVLHIPVEAVALPIALIGLSTRWRLGAVFYLACLLGTAVTDFMMVVTGVMKNWPDVVLATLQEAPQMLHKTAQELMNLQSLLLLIVAGLSIAFTANQMRRRAHHNPLEASTWLVASAALTTTLWVDSLFLLTALFQPRLSGLI